MTGLRRAAILFAGLCAILSQAGCATHRVSGPVRAIWVTRFDYATADDVRSIMDACAESGFNMVMFQVRGNGTAFWKSDLEPWAEELGGADPGFDPLALACDAAHERGMELHAWVNVIPSWRGAKPPSDPRQLYNAHPDWHWFDARGARQPLTENFYVSLNPCLPEVRNYLVRVFREICARYEVDGLHLDYVRFVDDLVPSGTDYPRDARTVASFFAATRATPDDDPLRWKTWKADQVTQLVRSIREMLWDTRRSASLSAAVGSLPEGPTDAHQRDSVRWVREGLLDQVFSMNYTADPNQFAPRAKAWARAALGTPLVMGIQLDAKHSDDVLESEVRSALRVTPHLCFFAYASLFPTPGATADEIKTRAGRRATLRRVLRDAEITQTRVTP